MRFYNKTFFKGLLMKFRTILEIKCAVNISQTFSNITIVLDENI